MSRHYLESRAKLTKKRSVGRNCSYDFSIGSKYITILESKVFYQILFETNRCLSILGAKRPKSKAGTKQVTTDTLYLTGTK